MPPETPTPKKSALDRVQADRRPATVTDAAQFLSTLRGEVARSIPSGLDADRLTRIVLTEVRKNPVLEHCTRSSFAGALLTSAQLGLEPGVTGESYLVPYEHKKGPLKGNIECQLILGYQGLAKLFYQHPLARHLDAQAVHQSDDFEWAYGTDPYLRHRPAVGQDRGQVIAYYAVASLTTGASRFVVLSPEEVRDLRGGRFGPKGDIPDPQRWMERKTVLRQLLKLMPKTPVLARAIISDEGIVRATSGATGSAMSLADPDPVPAITTEHVPPAVPPRVLHRPVEDVPDVGTVDPHTGLVVEDPPDGMQVQLVDEPLTASDTDS